jgi:hypothetical protein
MPKRQRAVRTRQGRINLAREAAEIRKLQKRAATFAIAAMRPTSSA